ncbi:hypothetical protein WUBG_02058 [Wuchereria bancrofti]|uniref:Uncharacterized protein n=1 Tax=Wuchereria bancrofti TaxID=6293 RepID=J9FBW5_WUCBA|nr:hypothetical protein WUBG_02058 [Wuchereria bancrofti]
MDNKRKYIKSKCEKWDQRKTDRQTGGRSLPAPAPPVAMHTSPPPYTPISHTSIYFCCMYETNLIKFQEYNQLQLGVKMQWSLRISKNFDPTFELLCSPVTG